MTATLNRSSHHKSAAAGDHEYTVAAVPLSQRRGPLTMALLWITMVTAFPCVLMGFQWHKDGLTLLQVLQCTVLSSLMLLAYAVPASHLGAVSGQTYGVLSRTVFGRWGTRLLSFNLIWVFVGWYAVSSLLEAEAIAGLFHPGISLPWLAVMMAMIMAVNNFWGFKGVANFARFFAAPVLIAWVAYSFCRATAESSPSVLSEVPHTSFLAALTTVSTFTIGFAAWGNEPDYWRHGRPKASLSAIPLAAALVIGQVIFPVTGWMISHVSGVTSYAAATAFMNQYSFAGLSLIAAAVISASYFAANDSNLYGCTNALENLRKMPHKLAVALLAIAGALLAGLLAASGSVAVLEGICSLNAIILPTPTVIMIAEWFLVARIIQDKAFFEHIPELSDLPTVRWPSAIALVAGLGTGLATHAAHIGVPAVQAWIAAAIVYLPLRLLEHKLQIMRAQQFEGSLATASILVTNNKDL